MRFIHSTYVSVLFLLAATATATIFGSVRGIIHDPQHRPVQGAMVMLKAKSSEWAKSTTTDADGEFRLNGVPLGEYSITVANPGFVQAAKNFMLGALFRPGRMHGLAVRVLVNQPVEFARIKNGP